MKNLRICAACGSTFDFDTGGYCSDVTGRFVCSVKCAKESANNAGRYWAIHDATDAIVSSNAPGIAPPSDN